MLSKAAVCWKAGDPWVIEEIEIAPPGPGEVLVEWAAAGLCHSDEGMRSGSRVPPGADALLYPMLGGHEGAGVIAQVGPGATTFEIGDHVLANFTPMCGTCRYCASGRGFLCNENKGFQSKGQIADNSIKHRVRGHDLYLMGKLGTFAQRTVVSERSVLRIDKDLAFESVCLVSCGFTAGWGSAVERGRVRPGDVVAVVGVGGLGAAAVQGARIAGAEYIIGIEPFVFRRDMAMRMGATSTAASIKEARDDIMHLTNGQGADVVILTPTQVTGQIIFEGLDITGKGAACVVTGMGPIGISDVPMDIGAFALLNKELRGCLFGSLDLRVAAPRLIDLYRHGNINIDAMITTYPLDNILQGLADSEGGRNVRGVLTISAER